MESTKALRKKQTDTRTDFAKTGITNVIYFLFGIIISRGTIMGELAPFGASYAAAVPKKYLFSSIVGAAFGYLLLKPTDSFRYIASIAAIGALRWLMSDIDKISRSRLFAPLSAFLPTAATGVALLFASTSTLSSFTDCIIEAVLAAGGAYFISTAVMLSGQHRGIAAYSKQETACLVMSGCVIILAFGNIAFEGISLGRIIAVTAILLCAKYGGTNGGAVCGIATGSVFSISDGLQGFLCGGFAFGGLMAGIFSPVGKIGCAIVFVISNAIMCLTFGNDAQIGAEFVESLIGSAVFLILPKEIGNFISPLFSNEKSSTVGEALRKNIVMRLDFASKAIYNVRNDVTNVSEKLRKLCSPSFGVVCENVEKEVCSNCGLKTYCYSHRRGVTRDDFFRLEELLEKQGRVDEKDVEESFVKNCCKKGEIARSMNVNYREYLSALEAQRRITDVRGVVAGQFSGVSDILSDLSREFKNTMRCDTESAERVMSALNAMGAIPVECVCLVYGNGKMVVELELSEKSDSKISRGAIMREVSKCCGRRFDLPTITRESGRIRAALCEMPAYDVEIGSNQHIANNGRLCGDCLDYFNDGMGKTYALVCDGMGTGGRAAVDGNMAVSVMGRLLRSGLSADSSLQIVNSALMVKSEDESLSTLDLTGVDLYTGRVTLKKAGAPATFIRKNGRVIVREMPSLPVGILNGVKFSSDTVNLSSGDMVVMVSDGVITGEEKWLEKLIRSWNEGSAEELARVVVDEAIKRREECPDDDITALVIRITDNKL